MFSDILGQQAVKQRLTRQATEGRIPHAQLLTGPPGAGKLQLAVAYGQYINCHHRTETDACGRCPSCLKYKTLEHPDLHFVFPIEKRGSKNAVCDDYVAQFRSLLREARYFDSQDWAQAIGSTKQMWIYSGESEEMMRKLSFKAYEADYKVMVVWLPEKMNTECANKILKLVEEPADRTVLLFVSERPDLLLPTIRSRVQQVEIPPLTAEDISAGLRAEFPQTDEQSLKAIAHTAKGNYVAARRAAAHVGEPSEALDQFVQLMRRAWLIGNKRDYAALQQLRDWTERFATDNGREDQKRFLNYAQHLLRENFIYNLRQPELNYMTQEEEAFSRNFCPFVNERNIEELTAEFALAERHIEQNVNSKIVLFDLALKVIVLLKK